MSINKNKWKELIECGIIVPSTTLSQIMTLKRDKVLQVHKSMISSLKDGRVGTWVDDPITKRKNIKAKNETELFEKLYKFYFSEKTNGKSKLKFCDIFDEWLEYKTKIKNNKPETKKQNLNSYKKYVVGCPINTMYLEDIKTIDLEEWAINTLLNYEMTSKKFNNVKIVVTGLLAYAKRKAYISENPWRREELEYTHLFKSSRIKASSKMIFYPDEIEQLVEELDYGYENNGNIANLGLKMNFDLGLRVGELAALKWIDIDWKNETVFIQRQEDSSGKVEEYVKSDSSAGYRELDLTDGVITILKRIRQRPILSEYIFTNFDGSRANKMQFEHRIAKAEMSLGWKVGELKYTHCIRRTVASIMNVSGFALEEIRRWLGHTDKATTLSYLYNPYRNSNTKKKVQACSVLGNIGKEISFSPPNESEDRIEDKVFLKEKTLII